MERLRELYIRHFGADWESAELLPGSGSNRKYFRIKGVAHDSVIGVIGTDRDENRAFVSISRHFRSKVLRAPEVLAETPDVYIQEDLGDISLFDGLNEKDVLKTVRYLPSVQILGARDMDFSVCFPEPAFSPRMVNFDLNYFKYCFLKPSGLEFNEIKLQDDFDRLCVDVLSDDVLTGFMYRDFQARNIMMKDGEPWLIDFQGGRRGPVLYDLASFAWHAGSAFCADMRRKIVDAYFDALSEYVAFDRDRQMADLRMLLLLRQLQELGAYGFRGRIEGKQHFIDCIPAALANIRGLLDPECFLGGPFGSYPYLTEVLRKLSAE